MRTFGTSEFLFILAAARWTIALSLIAFVGGAIGGLLVALARTSDSPAARAVSTAFVQVFQGTPLLLQLFLVFFGAPVLGWDINPWIAAGVALVLNTSAFLGEIWRGCIQAIARGDHRLHRSDARRPDHQQRHLPAADRVRLGGGHLLRPVLAAVAAGRAD